MAAKLKIKAGGTASKTKPKPKASTKTTRTRTSAKSTPAKKAPAKKAAATEEKELTRRSPLPQGLTQTQMNKILKPLEREGKKRAAAEQAHKDLVASVRELAADALDAGVPMHLVSTHSGISRQWLYKQMEMRQNGSAPAKKTKTTKATSTRKPAAKKASTKKTTGRKRIKARA